MPDLDIKEASKAHAQELNKSIDSGLEKVAQNLLYGLIFIGTILYIRK